MLTDCKAYPHQYEYRRRGSHTEAKQLTRERIRHDWSDKYCVQILKAIRESMTAKSRVLICDQVMNTTLGCPELAPAPEPLPGIAEVRFRLWNSFFLIEEIAQAYIHQDHRCRATTAMALAYLACAIE